jgi:Mn-containing catalase
MIPFVGMDSELSHLEMVSGLLCMKLTDQNADDGDPVPISSKRSVIQNPVAEMTIELVL